MNIELNIIIIGVIVLVIFVISVIVRVNKKRKVSNIIYVICAALVCLIVICVGINNKIADNYNNQFLKFERRATKRDPSFISNTEGLIDTAIKSNRSLRKITIRYLDTNYKSPEELKQLLSKINTSQKYLLKYDMKYNYIKTITLLPYVSVFFNEIQYNKENRQSGYDVRELISVAFGEIQMYREFYSENLTISVIYTSETGQKTYVNLNTKNEDSFNKLKHEIKTSKTYNIEFQIVSSTEGNIIITCNNK